MSATAATFSAKSVRLAAKVLSGRKDLLFVGLNDSIIMTSAEHRTRNVYAQIAGLLRFH